LSAFETPSTPGTAGGSGSSTGPTPCTAAPAAARAMLGHPVSHDRLPYLFTDQFDCRVPVVLRRRRQPVISGRHQRAVHDRHRIDPPLRHRRQREQRTDRVDHPVRGRMRHTEQRAEVTHRQVRPPVGRDQQHPISSTRSAAPDQPGPAATADPAGHPRSPYHRALPPSAPPCGTDLAPAW
jgi:hypothetical protein